MFDFLKPNKSINLMIVGVGAHARRIYIPVINRLAKKSFCNLVLGVDLAGQRESVEEYLKQKEINIEMHYVEKFDASIKLPPQIEEELTKVVKERNINGVVISTEPISHKAYAKWALKLGLNIFMDKPITTREDVSHDIKQAQGIYDDYRELLADYLSLQKKKKTIFSINVQRRYEAGFQKVFSLINEVRNRFNAPVTSIQSMHSDGVWIFPNEIVEQDYHPYNTGYGKCSHSGYHILDIDWQFYKAGLIKDKAADEFELFTSFLTSTGLLTQFNQKDYLKYFGKEYKSEMKRSDKELKGLYENYGEIDAFTTIRLLKENVNVCNVSVNLIHDGFSRRAWLKPNKDLYKGNGRVRHQYYNIEQGPFQCIQAYNYQSNDAHDENTIDDYKFGGNNHFEINVFRNKRMFGDNEMALRSYNIKDLDTENRLIDSKLYNEVTKEFVILEFVNFISGKIKREDVKSNITSHSMPAKFLSSIYQSNILYRQQKNPLVRSSIDER